MKSTTSTPLDALLAVLADAKRRQIFDWVCQREISAGDLHRALGGPTFGAISQHLAKLQAAGLVRVRASGKNRFYNGDPEALALLRQWLASHPAHPGKPLAGPPLPDSTR